MIIDDVDVILSSAASIYFHDPLLEALQINYFGALRLCQLAHECKHLEVFTHVSTAYTNSNLPPKSRVMEQIYPFLKIKGKDVEQVVSEI